MLKAPWYSPEEDLIFTAYAAKCEEEITMEKLADRFCMPLEEFKQFWAELSDEEAEEIIANF